MQILKNKKLFGLFNLLDAAIIGFIFVIAIPGIGYYMKCNERGAVEAKVLERLLNRQEADSRFKREGTVDIKASFKNLRQEDIGAVKVGDKEVLSDGTVLTEVVKVGVPEPNYFLVKNFRSWPDKDPYLHMMTGDGRFTLPVVLRLRG
ncbi:MAG: hypothetical protein PHS37_09920, partial [Candidatus Omnitrophica bacterium]|nr:hypothetical protein [Candidatus Omnitrophota bacterium]